MREPVVREHQAHCYAFGPFHLHSEVMLPELESTEQRTGPAASLIPIHIVADHLPLPATTLTRIDSWMEASGREFRLTVPGVASYLVRDGREVVVAADPQAHPVDVRIFLLGSVFGALCHQNGFLPLHASTVAHGERAVAFLGESGAGKSTLAAFLARRGHLIVSDDICLLSREGEAELTVTPVAGWLKLWRTSLDALGRTSDELHRVLSDEDKFRLPLLNSSPLRSRLSSIVLLERPENASGAVVLQSISPTAAVAALMEFTYRPELAEAVAGQESLFRRCARIAGEIRAFRLLAPLGWDRMDEVLDLIERELLSPSPDAELPDSAPSPANRLPGR